MVRGWCEEVGMLRRLLAWIRSWFVGKDDGDARRREQELPRQEMMQPLEDREFL
jgi:hypothetical protein